LAGSQHSGFALQTLVVQALHPLAKALPEAHSLWSQLPWLQAAVRAAKSLST
jgi:hypothetical protein